MPVKCVSQPVQVAIAKDFLKGESTLADLCFAYDTKPTTLRRILVEQGVSEPVGFHKTQAEIDMLSFIRTQGIKDVQSLRLRFTSVTTAKCSV